MRSFNANLQIIGINPFVFVPAKILAEVFECAGKNKGPIPIHGMVNKVVYKQTLVKYRGEWRLYINTSMLKDSPKRIGEMISMSIAYDPLERTIVMHPSLRKALRKNKTTKSVFDRLTPSLQKEIVRYIANLKTEASVNRNIKKAIQFLLGKGKFVGRDKP
jgi:transcription initiation factor TFIIIB Brf1 subunit/transcription initiation factor TFIIB